MMTRAGWVKFPCQGMTWHYARMQRSVFQAFDPLGRLREAAAAREAAGLRRRLVPRSPSDRGLAIEAQRACAALGVQVGCFRPPSVPAGQACLRLTGRAPLTENDISLASRVLAVVREHCHHGRNTAQAGRNTT
jgi:hypothetical protein